MTVQVKKILSGALDTNCYVVYDPENLHAAIVDPGEDGVKVISEIEREKFKPEILINTHGHYDHILSDDEVRSRFKIPLAVHKDEVSMLFDAYKNGSSLFSNVGAKIVKNPDMLLEDDQKVNLSFTSFKIMHTPGHTKGGICLLFDDFLITGDTLFAGTIGRTDLYGGDDEKMRESLSELKKLEASLIIYPGHGSRTTLSNELRHNQYLK
ncbi:MAG: MBL fold metallo-hydrolase [Endomicrobium sp.]|jgi:glyoxylase-like metal-dependent hydrolase (beta-lactamase superfamily II)|nr:MBL fold metallo-hydrolase [Endomicrobium sp.]